MNEITGVEANNDEMTGIKINNNTYKCKDADVGNLTQLSTTDKTSIVAAINELASKVDHYTQFNYNQSTKTLEITTV